MNAAYLDQELLHLINREVMQSNLPETSWKKQDHNMSFFTSFRASKRKTKMFSLPLSVLEKEHGLRAVLQQMTVLRR